MAPNAARRLVEEHHAELAHGEVEGCLVERRRLHVHLHEAHVGDAGLLGPAPRQLEQGCRDVDPDGPSVGGDRVGHRDGQGSAATADVAHPLAGPHVCGLEEVGRHRIGQPFPLGPRRRPLVVVPSLRLGFVGHRDTVPGTGRFGRVRVGLVILPTDRWREARRQWEWADEVGFATAWTYDHIRWGGMPDGPWHAAVPVLAAAAGGDGTHPAGHARRHAELPPPGHARPRGHRTRRRERRPPRPRAGSGERGLRRDGARAGAVDADGTPGALRGVPARCSAPIIEGRSRPRAPPCGRRTTRPTRRPARPGTLQRPLPLTIAAGGAEGLPPGRRSTGATG